MAITRRQFLKRAGVAGAGTAVAPSLFGGSWATKAMADTIGDRYFIVVFLDGGNDGLNTVLPADDTAGLLTDYQAARNTGGGGIRIDPGDMSIPVSPFSDPNTGTQLGFHPGLQAFSNLYDAGALAVVQGTGYPDYSLSHETSSIIWETANPTGNSGLAGTGWVGRHLGLEYGPLDIYGVTIDGSIAPEMRTLGTSVLAINRLDRFGFPLDFYDGGDHPIYESTFSELQGEASGSSEPLTSLIGSSGSATYTSTQSYPPLDSLYETDRAAFDAQYTGLGTGFARDMREVAKMIYGVETSQPGVNSRFFQVSNGGYDTHADQGGAETNGQHYFLHNEVSQAIQLFMQDMQDMGAANKVTIMVWSEFSRRIPQNSNGTDHGSQGPMFVIGGAVNGGVYGNHPNIDPLALDNQENTVYSQAAGGFRSTDFRDVYGTLLKHWINVPEVEILSDILPLDTLAPASDYWTVQDFDMGFI